MIKKGNPPHERINQSALKAVLNAARNFAAEQFDGHKYAFGLHHESDKEGEPPHPHVHLCVLVRNQFGERLNPRKNDLFEWRVRFAEKLRDEGVLCAATKRVHRGRVQKAEKSILRAMRSRGKVPDRYRQQAEELIEAVRNSERQKLLRSRLKPGRRNSIRPSAAAASPPDSCSQTCTVKLKIPTDFSIWRAN